MAKLSPEQVTEQAANNAIVAVVAYYSARTTEALAHVAVLSAEQQRLQAENQLLRTELEKSNEQLAESRMPRRAKSNA